MPTIGQTIGHYRLVAALGKSGVGVVYRAEDLSAAREVALKLLPAQFSSDSENLARLEREARAASALNHPNVITVYEIGQQGTLPYLAMELVEGRSIREILAEGPLPVPEILRLAIQIATGLAAAHEAGIVHGNLKPADLLVSKDGHLKIADFGLARLVAGSGIFIATADYISPEGIRGALADSRTDQFFFGNVLFEMATGKNPFRRRTLPQTMMAVVSDEPPSLQELNSGIPAGFQIVVERCLQKSPERRYGTTRELVAELEKVHAS
jgi:serine/threonine protein kinase